VAKRKYPDIVGEEQWSICATRQARSGWNERSCSSENKSRYGCIPLGYLANRVRADSSHLLVATG